jgi:hypothetical protein
VISRNAKAEKKRTAKEKTTKIKPTVLKQDAHKQERKWGISDPIQRSPFRYPWFVPSLFVSIQPTKTTNQQTGPRGRRHSMGECLYFGSGPPSANRVPRGGYYMGSEGVWVS